MAQVAEFMLTLLEADRIQVAQEDLVIQPARELADLAGKLEISYHEPWESLQQLDVSRNSRWVDLLDQQEIHELKQYVQTHSFEIDTILGDKRFAARYASEFAQLTN